MEEIWKDVRGFEGKYQVSNMGNVRSLNWRNLGICKNLKARLKSNGYYQVLLSKSGKKFSKSIHRLVAIHFVDGYSEDLVVNHKNENKLDNRADNLEWVTCSENTRYSLKPYRKSPLSDARNRSGGPKIRRTQHIYQITLEGDIVKEWESAISIKSALGYSDWSISECCRGNRKKAYGYKWQYVTEYNSQERL